MKSRRRKKASPVEETFTVVEMEDFETVCRVCDAEFLDEEDLKLHVAQVHLKESNGKTICKVCCAVLPSAEHFVTHFIFKHLENSSFCYYCLRVFTDPLAFDQHELKHCAVAEDAALTCSQCSNILVNRQELIKHEFQEHGECEDGVMLNKFFSLLSSALNIRIHSFIDALHKKALLTCRKCNYLSSSLKDFIEHLKTVKCQCLSCDNCFNVYKKKHSITNHILKSRKCFNYITQKDIQYRCPKCEKFISYEDFSRHQETCKVIRCLTCNKECNTIQELTDHTIKEHRVSISLEICKFCKKSFVGTLSLKRHMNRTHKNQNMYKYNCAYCSSMFTHPSKLFAHFFTRHKHIWPYSCKICNKQFRLRKHFTIHIKLQHKSVGFVEFGENLHVIFTDKKSVSPVEPQANLNMDNSTDASDSDSNTITCENITPIETLEQPEHEEKQEETELEINNMDNSQSTETPGKMSFESVNTSKDCKEITKLVGTIEIERIDPPRVRRKLKQRKVRPSQMTTGNDPDPLSDSEEEPLSNIRESLLKKKSHNLSNIKRRIAIRHKTAKLTCKICNKYCYTVQNYHHHLTLHEKSKMKRCIKCHQYFKSRKELTEHIQSDHASSKLIETLKSVLEKRKKFLPTQKPNVKPGESLKHLLEKRRREQRIMAQNTATNKFSRTIQKVHFVDDCTATITAMSDHGLSVKKFIETFKPDTDSVNISHSVTIRALTAPIDKDPLIKMQRFEPEPLQETYIRLRFPEKFKEPPAGFMESKVNVKLVQQLVTKPKLVNMTYNEKIPQVKRSESEEYCNMFADETDYTQYKNDVIPEVAQEVMLEDLADIPRTRRLAQEIIIPRIPEEHGGVRIGHLLPQAPFYKIVKVKKLIKAANEAEAEPTPQDADVKLPDGTRLISVKNPYAHLIPNDHLEEVLKANRSKYYTPKPKNIEKAIAKALNQMRTSRERRQKKRLKKV